jgi:hypothetical protein
MSPRFTVSQQGAIQVPARSEIMASMPARWDDQAETSWKAGSTHSSVKVVIPVKHLQAKSCRVCPEPGFLKKFVGGILTHFRARQV